MFVVGLTGGVGSGKSTVADLLARHGAIIVDADVIAREVVEPGTLGFQAIVARFGRSVLGPEGALDRAALAQIVFFDDDALDDLNGIVHPLVRDVVGQQLDALRATDETVVLVVPLLVESGRYDVDVMVVVDVSESDAVARLVAQRGWTTKEAYRRMAAQTTREARRAAADLVIENSGSLEELRRRVDQAWVWIREERDRVSA